MPSNEGRGYVLRRIMRRAIRYGVRLGFEDPFFYKAVQTVINDMHSAYPQLKEREDFIHEVVLGEEKRFSETLDKGLIILEQSFFQHCKKEMFYLETLLSNYTTHMDSPLI